MIFINLLVPFLAAVLGGVLNSVAGGGSFITFPSLLLTGVPPIQANATSTVGLWPASLAAARAFRRELAEQSRVLLLVLGVSSLIGGVGGAILLLDTSQTTFVRLIPFLMLAATLLFSLSPLMNARLRQRRKETAAENDDSQEAEVARSRSWAHLVGIAVLQLFIAIYGGYFGGGIGILMLATLGLMGMDNIHEMNAIKNTLAVCINGVAVITFIIAGAIYWAEALVMIVGASLGGYGGAYYARRLDQRLVRGFVITVGCVMTVYFFFKYGYL